MQMVNVGRTANNKNVSSNNIAFYTGTQVEHNAQYRLSIAISLLDGCLVHVFTNLTNMRHHWNK
jgi:hypothetical protein